MRLRFTRPSQFLLISLLALACSARLWGDITLASDSGVFGPNEQLILKRQDFDQRTETTVADFKAGENGGLERTFPIETGVYTLTRQQGPNIEFAVTNGETLEITLAENELRAKDSPDTDKLRNYERFRKESLKRLVYPTRAHISDAKSRRASVDEIEELTQKEVLAYQAHTRELNDFAIDQIGASIALYATSLRWNGDHRVDELTQKVKELARLHPKSSMVKSMLDKLQRFESVAIGSAAPDLSASDLSGKAQQLSSHRGKYVLVDFWASWCAPCRLENKNYSKIRSKYSNNDFEIFAVNLDKGKSPWQRASRQDNIDWIQISDSKGWQSELAQTYNVSALPASFLIDPSGNIIAKNLRGKALDKKLSELLEK